MWLVITEKLTPEGKRDFRKVLEWQKKLDDWLISHGATWKSVKHFVTLIGEPAYETWLEYPNYTAMDEDESRAKGFVSDPAWEEMISQMSVYFQRVSSRIMKEI